MRWYKMKKILVGILMLTLLSSSVLACWGPSKFYWRPHRINKPLDCGRFSHQIMRDKCCEMTMQNIPHTDCLGNWQYSNDGCKWVCDVVVIK